MFYKLVTTIALIYFVVRVGSFFKESDYGPDPSTISDDAGALVVKSGTVVRLDAGYEYAFKSILVHKGAVLEFQGDHPAWTSLKCEGNLWLEGTIRSKGFTRDSKDLNTTTYRKTIKEYKKIELCHSYGKDNPGGDGGAGGRMAECVQRSCFCLCCLSGKPGVEEKGERGHGGAGGRGMSDAEMKACGKKSDKCEECYLAIKGDSAECKKKAIGGCGCDGEGKASVLTGDGGQGGTVGNYGGLLYIAVGGNLYGNGTIDLSGTKGGRGEDGDSFRFSGGGGGGGGPGGNGGVLVLNIKGDPGLPTINVDGGEGGEGGKGGIPHKLHGRSELTGSVGSKGQPGKRGKAILLDKEQSLLTAY